MPISVDMRAEVNYRDYVYPSNNFGICSGAGLGMIHE